MSHCSFLYISSVQMDCCVLKERRYVKHEFMIYSLGVIKTIILESVQREFHSDKPAAIFESMLPYNPLWGASSTGLFSPKKQSS